MKNQQIMYDQEFALAANTFVFITKLKMQHVLNIATHYAFRNKAIKNFRKI